LAGICLPKSARRRGRRNRDFGHSEQGVGIDVIRGRRDEAAIHAKRRAGAPTVGQEATGGHGLKRSDCSVCPWRTSWIASEFCVDPEAPLRLLRRGVSCALPNLPKNIGPFCESETNGDDEQGDRRSDLRTP